MSSVIFISLFCFYCISLPYFACVYAQRTLVEGYHSVGYFNGSSFLLLNSSSFKRNQTAFSFKTCVENGTIIYQGLENMDRVIFGLEEGQFIANFFSTYIQQNVSISSKDRFDNNRWVHVALNSSPFQLALYVGEETMIIANASTHPELENWNSFHSSELIIGSLPDGGSGFVGCIMMEPNYLFDQTIDDFNIQWNTCPLDKKTCDNICPNSNETCYHGKCIDMSWNNQTVCECSFDYYGRSCSFLGINPCTSSPCLNGGICESENPSNFTCHCAPRFDGNRCENIVNGCLSQPCLNNGTCMDLAEGLFQCKCNSTGYTGEICSEDIDECMDHPCPNQAICVNRLGDFQCVCPIGFQGDFCNISIDYCLLQPCQNGGTCHDHDTDDYICFCILGFTGKHCEEEVDNCLDNDCDSRSEECVSEPGRHFCVCKKGFSGANCEEINECLSEPCYNNATCADGIDNFSCVCLPGYQGIWCQIDINECEDNPCKNGAVCNDLVNGYHCACTLGWTGTNCSEEFDPCEAKPCANGGSCSLLLHTILPGYECNCSVGFTGSECRTNIDDCLGVTCAFNQVCVDGVNTSSCSCVPGYMRDDNDNCTIDINECESSPCKHGGICHDFLNHFSCDCVPGYEGEFCEKEVNFCDLRLCQHNSICVPSFGSYTCYCTSGFIGRHCEAMFDSCISDPCIHGNCSSSQGVYTCECFPGYDGVNCGNDINECLSSPCLNEGQCNDLIGQFTCTCADGWMGFVCETNIDECLSGPCLHGGNCTDEIAGYACTCMPGYAGEQCEFDINECQSSPCQHRGSCIDEIASFQCVCRGTGYKGDWCEIEIDECSELDPCQNGGECIDKINDYECKCLHGYHGKHCEIDTDECLSQPCYNGATCLQRSNQSLYPQYFGSEFSYENASGFVCNCLPGYEGSLCDLEINECSTLQPCHNNASCIDLINGYNCSCSQGFGGRNCTVALVGCDKRNRCDNNATCRPYLVDEETDLHNYTCECSPGFTGEFCSLGTTGLFNGTSQAVFSPNSILTNTAVSFQFRTTVPYGLLASISWKVNSLFLEVYLQNGVGHLKFGDANVVISDSAALNDGLWHLVHLAIDEKNVTARFDRTTQQATLSANVSTVTDSFQSYVNIGSYNLSTQPAYAGCLRDFTVGQRTFAIEDAIELNNVVEGCVKHPVCSTNSCSKKGTCVDLWTKHRCLCDRPYFGDDCESEIEPSTFGFESLKSYALFELPKIPGNEFNFSVFTLTREPQGLIMHAGPMQASDSNNDSRIIVELLGGNLLVNVNEFSVLQDLKLNDGHYHFIDISIKGDRLNISLDNFRYPEEILPVPMSSTSRNVYLGGLPNEKRKRQRRQAMSSVSYYKGAFQDPQAGGVRFILFTDPASDGIPGIKPISSANILQGEVSDRVCGSANESEVSNPCKNNGTCVPLFNSYECICDEQWNGSDCEIPIFCRQLTCPIGLSCADIAAGFECIGSATFNETKHFMNYTCDDKNLISETLTFRIRTRSVDVTVLSLQSETGLILFRLNSTGRIEFTHNPRTPGSYIYNEMLITNGEWHNISFTQAGRKVAITVDDMKAEVNTTSPQLFLSRVLNGPRRSVYVGNPSGRLFKGCIDEVRIGGYLLPFYNQSEITDHPMAAGTLHFALSPISVLPFIGCHSDDVCRKDLNRCENNGSCVDEFNLASCSCLQGYTGQVCDTNIDDCLNVTCSNVGQCNDGVDGFTCNCSLGYEGSECEFEIDECQSMPCFNNGTCRNMIGSFECDCGETNFTGSRCDLDASQACGNGNDFNSPCLNGGICRNTTEDLKLMFTCQCFPPYYGVTCQNQKNFCENTTCLNNGTCSVNYTMLLPFCGCLPGYYGTTCENEIVRCSTDACQHNATCHNTTYGYICNCTYGHFGMHCENTNLCLIKEEQYCSNNGTCMIDEDSVTYDCLCPKERTGHRCQYLNPCLNFTCHNNATCQSVFQPEPTDVAFSGEEPPGSEMPKAVCKCTPEYTGINCETKADVKFSVLLLGSMFGGVFAFILLVVVVGYFLAVVLERRSTSGGYSPRKRETVASSPAAPGFVAMEMWADVKPPPRCERLI